MKKTKIYIDALSLAEQKVSGIGHLTLETVRALALEEGLHINLVLPLGKRKLVERHRLQNVTIMELPIPARGLSLLTKMHLMPPVDLLLGSGVYIFPNYRNWPLLFSKSLTYFHDVSFMLYPETVSPKNLKYLQQNSPIWLKRSDLVLTLSKSSKKDIVKSLDIDPEKVRIIDCGVDHEVFYRRDAKEIEKFKASYGLTCEKYLLYIGNFEPRKNLIRLINAYQMLSEDLREKYSLVLVGSGGWLNEDVFSLIKQLTERGARILQPNKYVEDSDLPALLSGATMLVHPALYEGFGLSPLQSMACGTPVIVANNSSLPEVVGDAGLLVDAYSEKDISVKIRELLLSPEICQMMGLKGVVQAKKYSWQISEKQLYDCILEVNK